MVAAETQPNRNDGLGQRAKTKVFSLDVIGLAITERTLVTATVLETLGESTLAREAAKPLAEMTAQRPFSLTAKAGERRRPQRRSRPLPDTEAA